MNNTGTCKHCNETIERTSAKTLWTSPKQGKVCHWNRDHKPAKKGDLARHEAA